MILWRHFTLDVRIFQLFPTTISFEPQEISKPQRNEILSNFRIETLDNNVESFPITISFEPEEIPKLSKKLNTTKFSKYCRIILNPAQLQFHANLKKYKNPRKVKYISKLLYENTARWTPNLSNYNPIRNSEKKLEPSESSQTKINQRYEKRL